MQIQPVQIRKAPRYPDRNTVLHNPSVLQILPARWVEGGAVKAALAASLAIMLSGCSKTPNIAPVFPHGNGFGSFGCMAVTTPQFISEAEAYSIVTGELAAQGINIKQDSKKIGVKIPAGLSTDYGSYLEMTYKKGSLVLDGYSGEHNIGFEFVSREDLEEWDTIQKGSVFSYRFKEVVEALNNELKCVNSDMVVTTLYDPMDDSAEDSIKDLKLQVRDFITWLKAQGII